VPTPEQFFDHDLAADRRIAEELQDRLRRDRQTAAAICAYLLSTRERTRARRKAVVRSATRERS
jgi:hypothetical protein